MIPTDPLFFDSQQSAAATLKLPIDLIRQAKREGCTAFRSGRIYVAPLKEWLRKPREHCSQNADESSDCLTVFTEWDDRREALFSIFDFLHDVHAKGQLPLKDYAKTLRATLKHVFAIGRIWKSGIDEPGCRKTIELCIRSAGEKVARTPPDRRAI